VRAKVSDGVHTIVLKTGPDRRLNRKKPELEPASGFLAHWTACAYEPE
jgi:hypothetical protein